MDLDTENGIYLGIVILVIGIPMTIVNAKAMIAGKHTTGDFIDRLLITGIIFIVGGIVLIIKSILFAYSRH